jgi:ankyrin repeat protein
MDTKAKINRHNLCVLRVLCVDSALRIAALSLLMFVLAGAALAAEKPALADAAEQGNKPLIRTLLDAHADVNAAQVDGTTALHWAVYRDDVETAGLLVRSGAKANVVNRFGVAPLFLACTNGNSDLVVLLLNAGADANAYLPGGETVLMTAARTGNLVIVRALLEKGANPNAKERSEQTPLMWAAAEGHTAIAQALIAGGANIRATLASGFTPLFFAVREGHIDVTRALLKAGIDVNETLHGPEGPQKEVNNASYKPVGKGTSPLLMAVQNGHYELAVALVEAGADPNDRRTGFTPLHTLTWVRKPDASDNGDPSPIGSGHLTSLEFVRLLVKSGADVNARLPKGAPRPPNTASRVGTGGATPFLFAADRADAALMRVLMDLGADPFLPNLDNTTPLMAAAGLGTSSPLEEAGTEPEALEAVRLLLDLGADMNAVNSDGDSAMHGAAFGNFPTIVRLLADRGASADIWKRPDKQGRTPLFIAEGYRGGPLRPSRPTLDEITRLMLAKGLSMDGPRPLGVVRDTYEKPVPSKQP